MCVCMCVSVCGGGRGECGGEGWGRVSGALSIC